MARDSFAARVRRGVEFLDNTVNDDWHLKIDLDSLNLADGACCVLGQLWEPKRDPDDDPEGNFDTALADLGLNAGQADRDVELGFNISTDDGWHGYRWLTLRWKQAIKERTDAT